MPRLNILGHCSYIGTNGINAHFRNFFRALSEHANLNIRNYTIGKSWNGLNAHSHEGEPYLNDIDRKVLAYQTLWNSDKTRSDHLIYGPPLEKVDAHIVADIVDHHYFYDNYAGPSIAYTVWETTKMPQHYVNRLKDYDEVWAASEWQRECMINQGLSESKVKVVPAGVEADLFYPESVEFDEYYKDGRFKFVIFGKWEQRKATKELVEAFLATFDKDEPVDLILSADNPYLKDGMNSTEERLSHYGLSDPRIKVLHFPSREQYIKFMKRGHVFLSCSRGEGWHLPLIEAMACGTPAIYSKCSGQMEFAAGKGMGVDIKCTVPNEECGGEYYEPDFQQLRTVMRGAYQNYDHHKVNAVIEAEEIGRKFSWEAVGKIGYDRLVEFHNRRVGQINKQKNRLKVLYVAPHLSTGGMPEYLRKKIELMQPECDVWCVEYEQIAWSYVVQRNAIIKMLGNRFVSLKDRPKDDLLGLIDTIRPDVIHFEEFPESFLRHDIGCKIYNQSRDYLIFESCHSLLFNPREKVFYPDKFVYVTPHQLEVYREFDVPAEVVEYPIEVKEPNREYRKELGFEEDCKHVINVGLFTPGKNQGEVMEYARQLLDKKVKFHFVGNMADNFKDYWEPLLKSVPPNCVVWGERDDVFKFYQAADLMIFTSKMETSPLVIREAISWKLPSLIKELQAYKNLYDKYPSVKYLTPDDVSANIHLIKSVLNIE